MRKSIYIILILALSIFGVNFYAQAGFISPDLQIILKDASPDQEISVIVMLADQVDTKTVAETKSFLITGTTLRTEIITTLKSKADLTQQDLKTY